MTGSPNPGSNGNGNGNGHWIAPALVSSGISIATVLCGYWAIRRHEKHHRSRWLSEEKEKQDDDGECFGFGGAERGAQSLYSVIGHFRSLELHSQSTVLEANRRRTTSYYEKAREAHEQSLVPGVPVYSELLAKRKEELDRLMFYHNEGVRSLRTVILMLDESTQGVLSEARQKILQPLNYSCDIYQKNVWIPELNIIPNQDMHVTVACPWWWHTMREENHDLNKDLTNRLNQALFIDFHHSFVLELERIILLGGKTLVALWRTVGERIVDNAGHDGPVIVCDRHAETIDPMVRLRRDIVDCFTNEKHEHNLRPLTHQHRKQKGKLERRHTIELKTPGLGSGDGFIHTTLCRLPLDCFSTTDVELEPIHRLCREATATYSGHRMLVNRFRFVETTGEGGDSNPCKNPLFDESIVAPPRAVNGEGVLCSTSNPSATNNTSGGIAVSNAERNAITTGQVKGLALLPGGDYTGPGGIEGLFDPPKT